MDVYQARNELRRKSKRHLLRLASTQKISTCLIGGRACCLHLHYRGFNFCISEIMGEGCQIEKSAGAEGVYQGQDEASRLLALIDKIGKISLPPGTKGIKFKVYRRDPVTKSFTLLGNILERRTKERRDNLMDLLAKVARDYSYRKEGTSTIFLLGQE